MSARPSVPAADVLHTLEEHVLTDGFPLVLDLEKSRGCRVVDSTTGRRYLDLYGCFGSLPVGFNHPWFDAPDVRRDLLASARVKTANSDIYCALFAEFVR